ncbi:MAG: ATP-binding protein [Tildeniella torsiva UHER 1998/13D]|jgi:AAA15 family ATPase/GTPase|nr:ATP-binding protein [Tildeniella torsiva UHER 1998/13D]
MKNTKLIKEIEIKYFRSIYRETIKQDQSFCVITGSNDAGKSNILKALNLFFTGSTDISRPFDFDENFNHQRKEEIKKQIKTKQFIEIKLTFNTESLYPTTLPDSFWVRRKWFINSSQPLEDDNLEKLIASNKLNTDLYKARRSKSALLNKIKFTYIPAIKDRVTFQEVLASLQTNLLIYSSPDFTDALRSLNANLGFQVEELQIDFKSSTNIPIRLELPSEPIDLFQSVRVQTGGIGGEGDFPITLDHRGDGVRIRFIPAILNYIAKNSKQHHIWGFEEPENSMEFKRAFELFEKCKSEYSGNAQIFVTSHSPAFIDLKDESPSLIFVNRVDGITKITNVHKQKVQGTLEKDPAIILAEELGHIALLSDMHVKMSEAIDNARESYQRTELIYQELKTSQYPVVLTEGKTDVTILNEAWKRIHKENSIPFAMKSCNTLPEEHGGSAAGADTLKTVLTGTLPDSSYVTVGIFDRDKKGFKAFELDRNFSTESTPGGFEYKVHKNRKAFAFLLPIPAGKEEFAKDQNLSIEMMFPPEILENEEYFEKLDIYMKTNDGVDVGKTKADKPHLIKIKDNKKVEFSESLVPKMDDCMFYNFKPLFDIIFHIVNTNEQSDISSTEKISCEK